MILEGDRQMNILYDSRLAADKTPFGPLWAGQECRMRLRVPAECGARRAEIAADGWRAAMAPSGREGDYDVFRAAFRIDAPGLYFYKFHIWDKNGDYDLFKAGRGTNMCAGDLWQLSVLPADYAPAESFRGTVYYQIFPDRFYKSGDCDLAGKLEPYTVRPFEGFVPTARDATDFAGGNFRGVREKLDYIRDLGVKVIYLNPIVMAWSNHRYDAADYMRPDPMLGTVEDFTVLCGAAHERGMRVVLDGVFSHTGSHSVYFDAADQFGGGAVSAGPASKYYKWYDFQNFPEEYTCWWGVKVMPCVNELDPDYMEYILGEEGVVATWLRRGADGFRLDVADELPDEFIAALRRRVRAVKPGAVVIGEVWEDASNKISYDVRRRYFTGAELDGVINYPFRTAILDFAAGRDDGAALAETVMTLAEHYPAAALDCTMAVLGTHDTERVGTVLPDRTARRAAALLQFALPGSPVIYYGDEAGLTGGRDPMNRLPFPWGREDRELQDLYRRLAALKNGHPALRTGDIRFERAEGGVLRFVRRCPEETVVCELVRESGAFSVERIGEARPAGAEQ